MQTINATCKQIKIKQSQIYCTRSRTTNVISYSYQKKKNFTLLYLLLVKLNVKMNIFEIYDYHPGMYTSYIIGM